jgi:hypothetical protein
MTLVLCILVLLALVPATAHAYIDPGSGSLLLQSLIALVVGGWLAFRLFASRFWAKMRGKAPEESADEGPDASNDSPTG